MKQLELFLLAPVGAEKLTKVVIAEGDEDAIAKATLDPQFADALVSNNKEYKILNLTQHFGKLGYVLVVQQEGMYH